MPLETTSGVYTYHSSYNAAYARWEKCRNVLEGEDKIKERGTVYLPKPNGMETSDYNAYKDRAAFVELTGRARDAMVGLVERKKPVLTTESEMIEEIAEDVTLTGESLDCFAFGVLGEVLDVGRAGVLVDYPVVSEAVVTPADIDEGGYRPYSIMYKAEDILDWREGRVGNRRVLTYVKLRETFEEPMDDNFHSTQSKSRLRVLRLDSDGFCVFEVYESTDGNTWELLDGQVSYDQRRIYVAGSPIRYIPFIFFGPFKNEPAIQKPPLLAMANLNVHHYQASADRNHAVHWADVPTPYSTQPILSKDGETPTSVKLGPTSFIQLTGGGELKFLEMLGHGIAPTKELMNEYVEQMSVLGNKILATDARAAEAAETASIHRAGEQAILAAIANNVSKGITSMLKMMLDYLGSDDDVNYQLSTDYLPYAMDSQTLIALIGAVSAGKMSDEEFFEALVAGEVVRPDKTYDEHKEEIARMPKPDPITPDSGGTFGVPDKGMANAQKGGEDKTTEIDGQARQDD